MICRICKTENCTETYLAQEVKQNTRETFTYFKCPRCGCLQIAEIPDDMGKYYNRYYSVQQDCSPCEPMLKSWLRQQLFSYRLHGRNIIGNVMNLFVADSFSWMLPDMVAFDASILDVGCGNGRLPIKMANSGFEHVQGIDPFIERNLHYNCRTSPVVVEKTDLDKVHGRFDLIMLHHVLEHIADQQSAFEQFVRLLLPKGKLLINIPIIDSFIWDEYRQYCFQLEDAPRHFYLHTLSSIELLAERVGLKIDHVKYLASPMIFTASERLKRGFTHNEELQFSKKTIDSYAKKAAILARQGRSGLACFYMSKKNTD